MNKQNSVDVLHFNQREAMNVAEKKKQEKAKRLEEEKQYLDRINVEINQEKNQKLYKKNTMIEQTQKDLGMFTNQNPDKSLRKKNSKLAELNTFKIGGDVREIKTKQKYQDYNDNLLLNPTRNSNLINYSNQILNNKITPKNLGYNIINNNTNKDRVENTFNHTSNEYKQMSNNENFDRFGRQVGTNIQSNSEKNDKGYQNNQIGHEEYSYQPQSIKGIENLENYSAYHDHYNYRPEIMDGKDRNMMNMNMNMNVNNNNYGYIQEKGHNHSNSVNNYSNYGNYSNYKDQTSNSVLNNNNQLNSNNTNMNNYQNNLNDQKTDMKSYNNYTSKPKRKVDLNTLPIPDNVTNVEEYERYLISLGIDPLTLEYVDDTENLEKKFSQMNLNSNDGNKQVNYNSYDNSNIKQEKQEINTKVPTPNYHEQNIYSGYHTNYQNENNINNNVNSKNHDINLLPNYGAKPLYKNQSQVLIADASAYTNQKNEVKKDYESLYKKKTVMSNPCKNIFYFRFNKKL